MTPPIDYKKIAHEFPQVPEWTKVVKWSPEDGCYVGYIEGPLRTVLSRRRPRGRARRAHRNRTRMASLTWYAQGASCEYRSQHFSEFKRKRK